MTVRIPPGVTPRDVARLLGYNDEQVTTPAGTTIMRGPRGDIVITTPR